MNTRQFLLTFIDESERVLQAELAQEIDIPENDFFSKHHYRLKTELTHAHKNLTDSELKRFYYHYCRSGQMPGKQIEKTYDLWESTFKEQAVFMDKTRYSYTLSQWTRLDGLIIFGFDGKTEIDTNNGFSDYIKFVKMYAKINSYTSIPGMIKKVIFFHELSKDQIVVNRISKALQHIDFVQDVYWKKSSDIREDLHYSYTEINFWGLIFVLVLSESEIAKKTISNFKAAAFLPKFEEQMEILDGFISAKEKMKR